MTMTTRQAIEKSLHNVYHKSYEIQVEVLDGGKLPAKANKTDAGFDVYATEDLEILPGNIAKTPLNIRMKLPEGSWARIETKSGLGSKGMLVYAGVVDEGYRGIPHVIATNLNWGNSYTVNGHVTYVPIVIKKGEKIAQITMEPHNNNYYMVEVEKVETDTPRATGGFGSSGA